MNEGARYFFAAVALVMLTLLTAMSPTLGAIAANLIRPAVEMVAKRSEAMQRYVQQRLAAPSSADNMKH